MQRLLKSLLRSAPARSLSSALIAAYIFLVDRTSRWELVGREHFDPFLGVDQGFIVAFWHQRLMMGVILRHQTDKRVFMLSSMHPDAEIIVNAAKRFGVEFIRGSTADPRKPEKDKKGGPALVQMIGVLRQGHVIGVNPDGPRGPRERAHVGVVRLAQFSGAPILPGAYSVTRGRFLKTWDRFLFPLPFSRGVFVGLSPIRVAADATSEEIEATRLAVERALAEATATADALVGRSPAGAAIG